MKRRLLVLCLALLCLAVSRDPASADEPWEAAVRREIDEQDRQLEAAKRRGTVRQVATRYGSRLSRQPTALNHFLLGRALYYDGDKDGAERSLRETLRLEPRFWFARLRLAVLEVERENTPRAEEHLREVLRTKPQEPDALRLLSQLRMDAEDWDGALRALEALVALEPESEAIRRNIVFCHMAKENWQTALGELRALRGRSPNDPMIRWFYARALFETDDFSEATRELESLARTDPQDMRVLDLLRISYARLEDWKGVQRTLERMLPHVPEGEMRDQIQQILEEFRQGRRPSGQQPSGGEETWPQSAFSDLLERAMDPSDVEGRRRALQAYHENDIPMMPAALVRRVHPNLEPDPVCRSWLLRTMGRLQNAALAQIAAFGLFDPEVGVRVVAAEALGDIRAASGLLYLLPYFLGPELGSPPGEDQVREMNAARAALIRLTKRLDAEGSESVWIPAERLPAMREDWQIWLAGPDGVEVRLAAIRDLGEQGEERPHYYLHEDVSDPNPRIARAAYEVLLQRAGQPSEEAVARTMWPKFPRYPAEQLTDENLPQMRAEVRAWWEAWLRMRKEREGNGDG